MYVKKKKISDKNTYCHGNEYANCFKKFSDNKSRMEIS